MRGKWANPAQESCGVCRHNAEQILEESNGSGCGPFAGGWVVALAWQHPDTMFSELVINNLFTKNDQR
jgi:hypothetical protein